MTIRYREARIGGKTVTVPSIQVGNCTVIVTGTWLKTARLFDEELIEDADCPDPMMVISELRRSPLSADLFTFARPAGDAGPRHDFRAEWDNLAVLSTTPFESWWNSLPKSPRRDVRRAATRGVVVRVAQFDDSFVRAVKRIYDEAPIRQGRRFWHYHKDLAAVRVLNETYLERSQFVGAYVNEELIGFIKYVRVDRTAVLMQILAMEAHRDKLATNALLKHTVELCAKQGLLYLTYGKYRYDEGTANSLTEFKERNGFREVRFPRYFAPLTAKGRAALSVGAHAGMRRMLPAPMLAWFRKGRARFLEIAYRTSTARGHH